MDISLKLGIRIRHYRKEKNITQEKLAEICSLHPTYIGQIERGEKNATLESIYRISRGLDIPMSKLLENIEALDDSPQSIPLNVYRQLLLLPQDKQQKIQIIINEIIDLIRNSE